MHQAPISVVIPTYNRAHIVPEAIDSVLNQTLVPAQIIVIDDGGKDNTGEALKRYGDRIQYIRQTNAGLSAARNHGIRVANQPLIALLDDDDAWHPRKIELQMKWMGQDSQLGLLGTEQFDWPSTTFPQASSDISAFMRDVTWEQLVVRTLIPVSSTLVRREVVDRIGDFDTTLRSSEDKDFFLRAAEVARVGMIDLPLTGYRDTPGSMCKNPGVREQAMRQILTQLDARDAWRGRWLLRRKAYSAMHNGCADVHARCGKPGGAALRALKSMAYYPLSYKRGESSIRFERPRRLAVNLMRIIRLKGPDSKPALQTQPIVNAMSAA